MPWLPLLLALLAPARAQEACNGLLDGDRLVTDTTPLAFRGGSATLRPESADAIDAIVCAMALHPELQVRVEVAVGRGTQALAQQRAEAIRDAVVRRGVASTRLLVATPADTVEGRLVGFGVLRPGQGLRAAETLIASLPPVDADRDGIPDNADKCPMEAETANGFEDADGCPDRAPATSTPAVPAATTPPPAAPAQAAVSPPIVAPPARAALPRIDDPLRTGRRATGEAAVVIGLEGYTYVPQVPHARRDAAAFYDFLVYTRGVPGAKAQLLTQGSRDHMLAAVRRAATEAGRGGRVWVYFAGHGAGHPDTKERMLLGDDVRTDAIGFASRGLPIAEIEAAITAAGATPLLVLDTCYAGVGRGGESLTGGTRMLIPDYAVPATRGGAQWTAAGPNELSAPLPDQQHGAFTYFAIGALRGWADGELDGARDGEVTAAEAQAFVARALRRVQQADQQPAWLGPDDLVLSEGATERAPF
jgi:hypothetical protein